jgi:pantoate--beta-alanine ligase
MTTADISGTAGTQPQLFHTPAAMRAWSSAQARAGRRIVVVPTMGALHRGHEVLIEHARQHGDLVVVTIFVNPMQFDQSEDFQNYPRPEAEDLDTCARLGVDAIYFPTAAAMYPAGFDFRVEPGAVAEGFEGAHRPGHFTGVATVVMKLFAAVQPDAAIFGLKDAQQFAVISAMVRDLDLGIEIHGVPTVRETDGLAMSSRNRRLSPAARLAARCVPSAIDTALRGLHDGDRPWPTIKAEAHALIEAEPLAKLEYLDLVDAETFTALSEAPVDRATLVVAAVWIDGVRLIDNQSFQPRTEQHSQS